MIVFDYTRMKKAFAWLLQLDAKISQLLSWCSSTWWYHQLKCSSTLFSLSTFLSFFPVSRWSEPPLPSPFTCRHMAVGWVPGICRACDTLVQLVHAHCPVMLLLFKGGCDTLVHASTKDRPILQTALSSCVASLWKGDIKIQLTQPYGGVVLYPWVHLFGYWGENIWGKPE